MGFKYLVLIGGGVGPEVWFEEVEIAAGNISEALQLVERDLDYDSEVLSIEKMDE